MTSPFATLCFNGGSLALWSKAGYEVQDSNVENVIGFAFETQHGVDAIGSVRKRPFYRPANTLSWIPRGCPVFSSSEEGGEYLVIQGLSAVGVEHPDAPQRPLNAIVDATAVQLAYLLRRILVTQRIDAPGRAACVGIDNAMDEARVLHADGDIWQRGERFNGQADVASAIDVLSATLSSHFDHATPRMPWITRDRQGVINRFIDRHLHESLTVQQIAAELGLSLGFTIRAFQQSLGMTPHRYIMERRLSHARRLLTANGSIADVAAECGFTDQAHFTRAMRQAVGVTPGRYRRDLESH